MFGKLVQLLTIPLSNEFETVYGIKETDFQHSIRHELPFGIISFGNMDPKITKTYIKGGYLINEKKDQFKEILIFNGELSEKDNENYLLVIIPHGFIETTSKKIAGRYPYESILEMHEGDILKISNSLNSTYHTYMAVKAGNEMFLIKKNR